MIRVPSKLIIKKMRKLKFSGDLVFFRPRGGVGSENTIPHSSDSDDSISSHNNHRNQRHQTSGNTSPEGYGLPKVQISGPGDSCESSSFNE